MNETVASVKELLSVRIDALEKITEQKFRTADLALVLQAKETERRLEGLNGKTEILQEIQSTYLLREVYEANQREIRASNSQGRLVFVSGGVSLIVSIVLLLIGHLVKFL